MILYKQRNFSEILNDTFAFIRENGKHFFTLYLQSAGIPLVILIPFFYYYYQLTANTLLDKTRGLGLMISYYYDKYPELLILILIVVAVVFIAFLVINNTFVPAYMYYYQERGTNFTVRDIFVFIKEHWLRILIFGIIGTIVIIPLGIVAGLLSFILLITIVGVILPLITLSLWYGLWYMDYMLDNRDIFQSFSEAWRLLTTKFWSYFGAFAVLFVVAYIIQQGLSLGFNLLFMMKYMQSVKEGVENSLSSHLYAAAMVFIQYFIGVFFQLVLAISIAIIYFSAREERYQIGGREEIEQIGRAE
ncbi:MAG: hypothetical protein GXO24_05465 [Chlorobi bacterium]|nr:hypothetical protein [Chlorobiota bacterium]